MADANIQADNRERAKTVLVTGASKGIGRAVAVRFAKAAYKVGFTYYSDVGGARETQSLCRSAGATEAEMAMLDLRSDPLIESVAKELGGALGAIDVLVNNAGVFKAAPLGEMDSRDIEDQLRVNLEGTVKFTKACLLRLDGGAIVNVGSVSGLEGYESLAAYCASKWGLRGFAKALAAELPSIRSYCVNPGAVATQMTNFVGSSPDDIAEIIFRLAEGGYALPSGADVNTGDYL